MLVNLVHQRHNRGRAHDDLGSRNMDGVAKVTAGLIVLLAVFAFPASPSFASSVWWGLTSGSRPTNLPPGGTGMIVVTAENLGYTPAEAGVTPILVEDTLPKGLEEVHVEAIAGANHGLGHTVNCSWGAGQEGECRLGSGKLPPYEQIEMRIIVKVAPDASSQEANAVSVSGGGAAGIETASRPLAVGASARFGVEDYEQLPEEEDGLAATQAGVHPFQLTTVLDLNTSTLAANLNEQEPAAMAKDLHFQLPPGLIGNPTPFPQCTDSQFNTESPEGGDECAPQTAIGAVMVTIYEPSVVRFDTFTVPLFNLVPLPGEPARFGFDVAQVTTTLNFAVRTGGDYGVTVNIDNINEIQGYMSSKVTIWGVPGARVHDSARGWACMEAAREEVVLGKKGICSLLNETAAPPLLSLPTSCGGPMFTTVQADSWAEPKPAHPFEAPLFSKYEMGGLDGCNRLQFNPEISVAPDVAEASTPTGLEVKVHVPQTAALNPESLSESTLKDTTVALPEGVAVNPGGAGGLEACSETQVGYLGKEQSEPDTNLFTSGLAVPFCPDASKIGTVEIETPLLPHVIKGAAYLATQNENPFGSLIALYLVAEDPVSGTLLKLTGDVELVGPQGQLVTTFTNTPSLPFENLRLHFFGESRAPFATPAHCGAYTTNATFTPWSGNKPSQTSSTFDISSGPDDGPCPSATLPFSPALTAGTTSNQAGGFSPFTMTMSREDGNQNLKSIELHMPAGLSGVLTGIPLCAEAQADAGTCSAASLVGETTVSVGLGGNPYTVTGGKVYLTGPYEGAPFGLSIVNPAVAGPFNLGKVIVRARLELNPTTAAVTVTSDSSGPYAIPPMIDGIPLEIKHINVTIVRAGGFTFNPTNCNPLAITGTLHSVEGGTSSLSVPFQATNCATLKFQPKFAVSTSGKTSKAGGASLTVKVTRSSGPTSDQANFASVKVDLPKQLPSRLTTLQKACTAAQFDVNPAGCPAASAVGHARVLTPLLPVPLEGPAYFVSHGGEAFPSLIFVLQGYGVTIDVTSTTFISKSGITSATLKTVPDAPFTSFELTFPEGKYSALAANGNLCKSKLAMPTAFVAQNGLKINQSTKVAVTGCPKSKKAKQHNKKHRSKSKGNGSKSTRSRSSGRRKS
jgi:hypothetical protein